ncbi:MULTISPECIES: ABC transporter ATP-binding protein [unclassified Enterococcus]|uniref:ABC transporter ATP-binding protein n=1 Tax=unclassified Enterococcus TaxID=2608891 RepID=UPI0013EA6DC0|nr:MULTISPECIES: ABC transporter ATP-binding protein [unclassified Enterococcus]
MSIQIEHLDVTIEGLEILKEIDLTVPKNSFTSLIAPSGAGKSTLLKALTGVQSITSGSIKVDGKMLSGLNTAFSYMPQEDMLLPWLDVYQNVTLYQRINHQKIDKKQVLEYLTLFGLEEYQDFLPEQLSGGMRQRTALLRTMMNQSHYLLLDEPFGALDAMTRGQMQDWLLSLPEKMKRTTLLVTHDIEEAIYLSDRIVVLSKRPARVIEELAVPVPKGKKSREWLIEQAPLKQTIYQLLAGETHAE